jgi:hypothetical protein
MLADAPFLVFDSVTDLLFVVIGLMKEKYGLSICERIK